MTPIDLDVTIAIPTYNRAPQLRAALASLMAQETAGAFRFGILVIDNASTDDTAAVIAEAARASPVPFRSGYEARAGVACARNRCVKEATGTWLAFFDDDQVADPRWLAGLLARAQEARSRCVVGAARLLDPSGQLIQLLPRLGCMLGEKEINASRTGYVTRGEPGAGNLLLARSVFDEVGAFNEELVNGGEDLDLFQRIRRVTTIAYTPDARVYHVIPRYRLEAPYLRWNAFRYGEVMARQDLKAFGRAGLLLRLVARLGQAALVSAPAWLWARLRRDRQSALWFRCRLWTAASYVRCATHLTAPRLFPQHDYFAQLQFRSERERFAT